MLKIRHFAAFAGLLAACSGGGGAGSQQGVLKAPEISVRVDGQPYTSAGVSIDPGTVAVGQTRTFIVQISNIGEADLQIKAVTLDYIPPPESQAVEANAPAFRLGEHPALPALVGSPNVPSSTAPRVFEIPVIYQRYDDELSRSAKLYIENNDKDASDRLFEITFRAEPCNPHLAVSGSLDLGQVKAGEVAEKSLPLRNTGACALLISSFLWKGSPGFALDVDGQSYPTEESEIYKTLEPPLAIEGNSQVVWKVKYSPPTGAPARAWLTLFASNDPEAVQGKTVEILANTTGPCIEVVPNPIEFGGKLINQTTAIAVRINSCGTADLVITDIALKQGEGLSPDFALDYSSLPGGIRPSKEAPVVLPPGQYANVDVWFTPDTQNPVDPTSGQPIKDRGVLLIENNTFTPLLEVEVSGHGVPVECPQPVIIIQEGEEVPPQTTLHLYGDQSVPSTGSITKYQWSVDQPSDNKFNLLPSMSEKNVTHEVNVAGTYTYCLDVCDALNCSSDIQCKTTACKKVVVIPSEAIHCELTWRTPADKNEYDEGPDAGSDMDLHFLHPYASGPDLDNDGIPDGWFDLSYDCFWYTCSSSPLEWGSLNPNISDNPRLDRDDTDGAGPENINLDVPEDGKCYKVGVHYWDDHGFGASYPQVKCYCWGKEAFKKDLFTEGIPMFKCDMWEVATICWPDCKITAIQGPQGGPKITHNYQNPAFVTIGSPECGP